MKRSFIMFLFVLLGLAQVYAQNTCTARVVDASTGDALPMASVYISASHSTITNQEGDFSIQANPSDMLRITYVGYNTKNIKASDLGSKVELKPYTRMLQGSVYWSTLFNICDYDIGEGTSTYKEDIYKALSLRGNDEAFRKNYQIVKTSSTEEAIIKKFEHEDCFGNFSR